MHNLVVEGGIRARWPLAAVREDRDLNESQALRVVFSRVFCGGTLRRRPEI